MPTKKRVGNWQPENTVWGRIVALIEEVPAENFVAVCPSEPSPATRRLFERCEVLVVVSPLVGLTMRVMTPAEFLRWVRRLEAQSD